MKGFKEFLLKTNALALAIGVIIGGSIGKVVSSLVNDILMPPIGLLLGGVDFSNLFVVLKEGAQTAAPYATLADAQAAGAVTLNWGVFLNTVVNFVVVAFAIFLVVKAINTAKRQEEAAPPAPPEEVVLLREIRDSLRGR